MRDMHHQAVKKSNLAGSTTKTNKLGAAGYGYDQPLCPKPVRLPPAIPEFLKPLSQPNPEEESGVVNMITEKLQNSYGKELECGGCLPCYSGSPPRRTKNPLIHDVEFLHQMELVSPFSRTKLSHNFAFTSASPF